MYLLGIDIGTSAVKGGLFDSQGHAERLESAEYGMEQPRSGWAEQNPEVWWQAVRQVIRKLTAHDRMVGKQIGAIGLSGQMHGLVMLDSQGNVLRPCILWCDGRSGEECREIEWMAGAEKIRRITANPVLPGFTAGKILWVRRHEPEIYEKCRHILLPKDYVRYRLTGELASDVSDASGTNLLDVERRQWRGELLAKLQIEMEWMPRLYESAEITGVVSRQAGEETGLLPGTPVVGGAGDNMAAAVGCGVVREGKAFNTIGTSGVIFAPMKRMRADPKGRVHTFCHAVPGMWAMMSCTLAAGLSVQWFRNQFCETEDFYSWMNGQLEHVPPGANGVVFLPYLMGERSPLLNERIRGGFLGLSAGSSRADFMRAVIEGVSYSQRQCLDILREQNIVPEEMILCGGGTKNDIWRQILAALYEMPVTRIQGSGESGVLGAAILAGVGAGIYRDVSEGCTAAVHMMEPEQPRQDYMEAYRRLYPRYCQASAVIANGII